MCLVLNVVVKNWSITCITSACAGNLWTARPEGTRAVKDAFIRFQMQEALSEVKMKSERSIRDGRGCGGSWVCVLSIKNKALQSLKFCFATWNLVSGRQVQDSASSALTLTTPQPFILIKNILFLKWFVEVTFDSGAKSKTSVWVYCLWCSVLLMSNQLLLYNQNANKNQRKFQRQVLSLLSA